MKKFIVISLFCSLFSFSANATGIFVGADLLQANSSHKARNLGGGDVINNAKQDAENLNFGVNAGVRFDLLTLFASAEIFYDNLQTSATNYASSQNQINAQDVIEINNRYGAKANVGFSVFPMITPFLTYGLAKVNYSNNVFSQNSSLTKTELTPLYGIGLLVDLPFLSLSVKASYDYQKIDMASAQNAVATKTNLGVAKIGVIYNF